MMHLPTEPNIVLSIARAAAAPAFGAFGPPPIGSGAGTGGASGIRLLGEVRSDPGGPSTSDGGRP